MVWRGSWFGLAVIGDFELTLASSVKTSWQLGPLELYPIELRLSEMIGAEGI